jgi:hypothetical protein
MIALLRPIGSPSSSNRIRPSSMHMFRMACLRAEGEKLVVRVRKLIDVRHGITCCMSRNSWTSAALISAGTRPFRPLPAVWVPSACRNPKRRR